MKCYVHFVEDEELIRDPFGGICSANPKTGMIVRDDNHGISKQKLEIRSNPYIHVRKGIVTEIRRISFCEMEVVSYDEKFHEISDRYFLKASNF